MIVVLTGSHGCGKSSLIEHIMNTDLGENIVPVNSVTRTSISNAERRIDGEVNLDQAQLNILCNINEIMMKLIDENNSHPEKIFLLDRCIFDFIAYTRCFYRRGMVSSVCLNRIETQCLGLSKYYDLVGYLGIEFPIIDDGVRSLDEELRRDVDLEIRKLISTVSDKVIKLSGSYERRIQDLKTAINTHLHTKL